MLEKDEINKIVTEISVKFLLNNDNADDKLDMVKYYLNLS